MLEGILCGWAEACALRDSEKGGSLVAIVTVPELKEHSAVGRIADPPSASQPMENTGGSGDLQNGRRSQTDNRDIPLDLGT